MDSGRLNDISFLIIQAAIEVHRTLGPGLLESVYRACMIYELRRRNLSVVAEQMVPICYKDVIIDGSYRLDLLVGDEVVLEIKSVEVVLPVHHAQLLSYLRLTKKPLGLLINFNVPVLIKGVKRMMNGNEQAALRSKQPLCGVRK
ncbi:MAG: GxxExxY protein [Candidatus Hydrogenedentales bacterium]